MDSLFLPDALMLCSLFVRVKNLSMWFPKTPCVSCLTQIAGNRKAQSAQIHACGRRDNCFLKIGMVGIMVCRAQSGRDSGVAGDVAQ
jgi:hypothetical protein